MSQLALSTILLAEFQLTEVSVLDLDFHSWNYGLKTIKHVELSIPNVAISLIVFSSKKVVESLRVLLMQQKPEEAYSQQKYQDCQQQNIVNALLTFINLQKQSREYLKQYQTAILDFLVKSSTEITLYPNTYKIYLFYFSNFSVNAIFQSSILDDSCKSYALICPSTNKHSLIIDCLSFSNSVSGSFGMLQNIELDCLTRTVNYAAANKTAQVTSLLGNLSLAIPKIILATVEIRRETMKGMILSPQTIQKYEKQYSFDNIFAFISLFGNRLKFVDFGPKFILCYFCFVQLSLIESHPIESLLLTQIFSRLGKNCVSYLFSQVSSYLYLQQIISSDRTSCASHSLSSYAVWSMCDGVLFMIMNKDCQGLAIANMLVIWFCCVSSCCLFHSFCLDYNQTYIIQQSYNIAKLQYQKYRAHIKRMYKQPSSKTIPPGLTTNLSRLQLIYNIYDNNVACIGTLDDEQNMCCTNLNSKKKAKQKWIFRYWNCLQKQQQINEWQVKIEKGYEIGDVIAVQKRTYALWILPKNTRKLNKQQEKKEQLKLQQHIIILQAPVGHKMEVPTYHKMPIKSIKSNGIIIKEQNFFQVKRQFSYQHKLNALVCVWQLRNKQAEVVQFNNLAHANHQPSFIIRLTYISLSHLLSFQGQSTSKVQIGPYLSRQFYIGFRNAAKSYTIVHPSLDLFTTHSSQLIRSMPLLICYEPIPMLPSHMLQAIDRRLSLSIFSMTRDAFSWPNPSVCKVVQVKGYILGIDDTFDQLEVNDQQGQAQIGQIDAEQQEWVDEQENEENQQNEGEQNVNQLVNGLIVDKYSLDTIINLTIHTTHNKKQKLLHVSLNVQKWQGIVKNVSQFPFQNPLDSVLSVGGNVSYIWSWVASFNQNNMIESQTVYLMGLENSTQYKLIQKQILRSSTKHPNMYIDDFNEISMLQTPPVVWSVNQSKEEEEQLQIWKMNSKKVIYMQMLKQIFGKGENQETDVFVDVLAQSTLALL